MVLTVGQVSGNRCKTDSGPESARCAATTAGRGLSCGGLAVMLEVGEGGGVGGGIYNRSVGDKNAVVNGQRRNFLDSKATQRRDQ